jgi:hypothetical protein
MERTAEIRERIRGLNDAMRKAGPATASVDRWVITEGVLGLGTEKAVRAIEEVKAFETFTSDNDPYGEHDFGAFDVAGQRLFWKIDYYNLLLDGGSPDPTDTSVTLRVLTVMLALEY